MRSLQQVECLEVSGGDVLTHLNTFAMNGLCKEAKTLAITALSTGLVLGSFLPFASVIGISIFAGWAIYDITSDFSNPFTADETTYLTLY